MAIRCRERTDVCKEQPSLFCKALGGLILPVSNFLIFLFFLSRFFGVFWGGGGLGGWFRDAVIEFDAVHILATVNGLLHLWVLAVPTLRNLMYFM